MKEFVLVGGIQYSGKSYFCRELVEGSEGRFVDLGLDTLYNALRDDPATFRKCMRLLPPEIKEPCCIRSDDIDINDLARITISWGGEQLFVMFMQQLENAYIIDELSRAGGKVPVTESLFYSREVRENFYEGMKELMEMMDKAGTAHYEVDLDSARKILMYFDIGVEACERRMMAAPKMGGGADEEMAIRAAHSRQEIPSPGELPNLEVIVVKNEGEVEKAAEQVRKMCA